MVAILTMVASDTKFFIYNNKCKFYDTIIFKFALCKISYSKITNVHKNIKINIKNLRNNLNLKKDKNATNNITKAANLV